MKTELVFFDGLHQSKNGTFRGLIAFTLLVSLSALWFFITYDWVYKSSIQKLNSNLFSARTIVSFILIYLLICSALAVQMPSSWDNALVYGLLVGLVVVGVANLVSVAIIEDYSILTAIVDTVFAMIMCGIVSVCVYHISKTAGWYS